MLCGDLAGGCSQLKAFRLVQSYLSVTMIFIGSFDICPDSMDFLYLFQISTFDSFLYSSGW